MDRLKKNAGVTLLELVITIAVIGILAALAYPSLQNLVRDGRVVSQANELAALVTYAHSQATQGIPQVTLAIVPGANWTAILTSSDGVLRQMMTANTILDTATPANLPIVVNNRGLVVSRPICLDIQHSPGTQARSVSVRISGQVFVERAACNGG
jgi:type IV fimbrial biogenesis protein FimT